MKSIVAEICRAKREARVMPALATELEIQRALSSRGVPYTAKSFSDMCNALAADPRITTIRTLNQRAYANNTQEQQEELSAEARSAGQKTTGKHAILSKPTVAKSEKNVSRATPTVCGMPEDGEDNTSDGSRPHYADQYWWREI